MNWFTARFIPSFACHYQGTNYVSQRSLSRHVQNHSGHHCNSTPYTTGETYKWNAQRVEELTAMSTIQRNYKWDDIVFQAVHAYNPADNPSVISITHIQSFMVFNLPTFYDQLSDLLREMISKQLESVRFNLSPWSDGSSDSTGSLRASSLNASLCSHRWPLLNAFRNILSLRTGTPEWFRMWWRWIMHKVEFIREPDSRFYVITRAIHALRPLTAHVVPPSLRRL